MDPDRLAETAGTLSIRSIKDTGLDASPAFDSTNSSLASSHGPSTVNRKELNARDYFDETNASYNNSRRDYTPQNTLQDVSPPVDKPQDPARVPAGRPQSRSQRSSLLIPDDYTDELPLPVKLQLVGSNSPPHGDLDFERRNGPWEPGVDPRRSLSGSQGLQNSHGFQSSMDPRRRSVNGWHELAVDPARENAEYPSAPDVNPARRSADIPRVPDVNGRRSADSPPGSSSSFDPNVNNPAVKSMNGPQRPDVNNQMRVEGPRPDANNQIRVDGPRPEVNNPTRVDGPRPDANNLTRMDGPRPDANNLTRVDGPRPEVNNPTRVDAPRPDANNPTRVDATRPDANNQTREAPPRPDLDNPVNVDGPVGQEFYSPVARSVGSPVVSSASTPMARSVDGPAGPSLGSPVRRSADPSGPVDSPLRQSRDHPASSTGGPPDGPTGRGLHSPTGPSTGGLAGNNYHNLARSSASSLPSKRAGSNVANSAGNVKGPAPGVDGSAGRSAHSPAGSEMGSPAGRSVKGPADPGMSPADRSVNSLVDSDTSDPEESTLDGPGGPRMSSPGRSAHSLTGKSMNSPPGNSTNSPASVPVGPGMHSPAGGPSISSESESPFDHMDTLLPNSRTAGSPRTASVGSAASNRQVSSKLPSQPSVPSLLSFDGDSVVGVRQKEAHTRRLETENLELRLKLQQYREMNAGEQEITRIKRQVGRAEQRIDELEQALERKNETINQLIAERDEAVQRYESEHKDELFSVITELQASISELERANEESVKTDQKLFARAHEEFPDIIPANAGVEELVSAVRNVMEQNSTLTRVAGLASSLKVSHAQIQGAVHEVGKKGDPATCIRELAAENSALRQSRQREHELMNLLQHSQETRRDLELVIMRLEESGKESKSLNYSIIRKFFAELFDVLGETFQETVEAELQAIVERSQGKATSKIPALSDLMVRYTRQIAELANNTRASADQERKILMLDGQVQSLEHLIELKMDKLGADNALRAQIRDLKRELKLVSEKRKSEWLEYQRALNKSQ